MDLPLPEVAGREPARAATTSASGAARGLVLGYAATFCAVQAAGATHPAWQLTLDAALIVVATNHWLLSRAEQGRGFLVAVIVATVGSATAAGLPLTWAQPALRVLVVAAVTLVSLLAALTLLDGGPALLRRPGSWRADLLTGLLGLPLAAAVWAVTDHGRTHLAAGHGALALGVGLAAAVLGALVEEAVFRGLVQDAAASVSPRLAVPVSASMFTAFYLGSGPAGYLVVVAATGLVLGLARLRTGSLWGVVLAHAVVNVAVLVVLPVVT